METTMIAMPSYPTRNARTKSVQSFSFPHAAVDCTGAVRGITGVLSVKAGVGDAVATPAARGSEPPPRRDPR